MLSIFNDWRGVIANLRMPDAGALASHAPLRSLLKSYEAYLTTIAGARHVVLLPTGLAPKPASQVADDDAAKRVIVLKNDAVKWQRVWPSDVSSATSVAAPEGDAVGSEMVIEFIDK